MVDEVNMQLNIQVGYENSWHEHLDEMVGIKIKLNADDMLAFATHIIGMKALITKASKVVRR